jgi:hypothetical protein
MKYGNAVILFIVFMSFIPDYLPKIRKSEFYLSHDFLLYLMPTVSQKIPLETEWDAPMILIACPIF